MRLEDAAIFDLDRHRIPEHGGVPAHWHYDVRYVVRAGDDEAFTVSDESHALAWRDIAALAVDDACGRIGASHGGQMAAADGGPAAGSDA